MVISDNYYIKDELTSFGKEIKYLEEEANYKISGTVNADGYYFAVPKLRRYNMLDVEIAKKINWYKNDVDSIYHSSIEPIEPKWLNSLKEFIENEYHVRIMTLAYWN